MSVGSSGTGRDEETTQHARRRRRDSGVLFREAGRRELIQQIRDSEERRPCRRSCAQQFLIRSTTFWSQLLGKFGRSPRMPCRAALSPLAPPRRLRRVEIIQDHREGVDVDGSSIRLRRSHFGSHGKLPVAPAILRRVGPGS